MDISQSHVAATKAEGELFVVDAQQVQNRGVDIVNVDGVFDGAHSHFIRSTKGHAAANSGTGHPDRVTAHMMIAAIASGTVWSAPHFSGPDDKGVIK